MFYFSTFPMTLWQAGSSRETARNRCSWRRRLVFFYFPIFWKGETRWAGGNGWDRWRDLEATLLIPEKKMCAAPHPQRSRTSANRCRCSAGFSASLRANMHLFDRQLIPGLLASSAPTPRFNNLSGARGAKVQFDWFPPFPWESIFDCQFNYFLRRNRCISNPRLRSNLANTCRRCLLPN